MAYLFEPEFPDWLERSFNRLSPAERTRILAPHPRQEQGRDIQNTILDILRASKNEGETDEELFERLTFFANTNWR